MSCFRAPDDEPNGAGCERLVCCARARNIAREGACAPHLFESFRLRRIVARAPNIFSSETVIFDFGGTPPRGFRPKLALCPSHQLDAAIHVPRDIQALNGILDDVAAQT